MPELTSMQAGEYMGVTDAEVRRYIREGRLPARKKGRGYLIKQSDLEAFKNGTLSEEAFSTETPSVDPDILNTPVTITIGKLIELGALPGRRSQKVYPFLRRGSINPA